MYCKSTFTKSSLQQLSCLTRMRTNGKSLISTCCVNRNQDKSTRTDRDQTQDSESTESLLIHRLAASLQNLERTLGTSQRSLHKQIRHSMPLLKPSSRESDSSHINPSLSKVAEKPPLNLIQSMQLKLALSALESDSPKPFAKLSQSLDKFQQTLLSPESYLLESDEDKGEELTDTNNVNRSTAVQSFESVRPSESFLVFLVAHLMNGRLADSPESDPMRKHLLLLLNVIQMIRLGSRTRLDVDPKKEKDDNAADKEGTLPMQRYRLSILKGPYIAYSLMRLNVKNITDLMSRSLEELTAIQFWLEKEAFLQLVPQQGNSVLQMNRIVREQLASGQLLPVWQSVVSLREGNLLGNGCQSVAYLLGKDSPAEYAVAQQLGTTLATIFSLLDDYTYLKYECQLPMTTDLPEEWTATKHFAFLFRLPVLLYLKEANDQESRFGLSASETECHKLARNVIGNLEQSNALPKTAALIEHYVCLAQQLVSENYKEETPVREAFLALLATCAAQVSPHIH